MNRITLPHPNTGAYADLRLSGQVVMGGGALVAVSSTLSNTKSDGVVLVLLSGIISGVALGILGHDLYKIGENIDSFFKHSWSSWSSLRGDLCPKIVTKAAIKGTFLNKFYYNIAALSTGDFSNVKVSFGPAPSKPS